MNFYIIMFYTYKSAIHVNIFIELKHYIVLPHTLKMLTQMAKSAHLISKWSLTSWFQRKRSVSRNCYCEVFVQVQGSPSIDFLLFPLTFCFPLRYFSSYIRENFWEFCLFSRGYTLSPRICETIFSHQENFPKIPPYPSPNLPTPDSWYTLFYQ